MVHYKHLLITTLGRAPSFKQGKEEILSKMCEPLLIEWFLFTVNATYDMIEVPKQASYQSWSK